MEQNNANTPLIDHWSYSAMTLFLRNRLAFKKKYILKIYDDLYSPSAVVGQACHKAVEEYLNGADITKAIDAGHDHIKHFADNAIDYGKTGTREKMIKDYTKGIQFYFDEIPAWDKRNVLMVEEKITEYIHDVDGNELSIPAKCFVDVVWESTRKEKFADFEFPAGVLFIEDNKFVRSYSDADIDDPARVIQAMFNYHCVKEKTGRAPAAMLYREVKLSENTRGQYKGQPQCQYYVIKFDEHPDYFSLFNQLYNDCTREISRPDINFLPNFQDMFDGQNSFEAYRQNLITVDPPVVAHKQKEITFEQKRYHESAPDKVENKNLTPDEKIRLKLQEFGIPVEMQETHSNSSVTMYTLKPSRGVKMKTIESHAKDIAIALKARSIRVQAPIMGTDMVGIEIPNENRKTVQFFADNGEPRAETGIEKGTLMLPIGIDVYGKTIKKDLRDMPHLLIAGSTGSGKSVMLNVILHSLTHQMSPEELNLVLIDPKRVELSQFKDKPHLLSRVIYEHREAIKALDWLVKEMEERYQKLEQGGYRNIGAYNDDHAERMPYLVVVIDEFADLILTKERGEPSFAELMIVRLAQKARAVGIHLVIATQRPTVDVVTGLIKANLPARIAFMTSSRTDSQVILDKSGAEELVGKGDMLFLNPEKRGLQRLQGFYA